jgi:hypothetical protein
MSLPHICAVSLIITEGWMMSDEALRRVQLVTLVGLIGVLPLPENLNFRLHEYSLSTYCLPKESVLVLVVKDACCLVCENLSPIP